MASNSGISRRWPEPDAPRARRAAATPAAARKPAKPEAMGTALNTGTGPPAAGRSPGRPSGL
jgi:hypothetical protein